jgi:hypothetical protein
MKELGIYAEVNLTSNEQTGSLQPVRGGRDNTFQNHSLINLIAEGVPTILSTDGHSVMHTTLSKEYKRAEQLFKAYMKGRFPIEMDGELKYFQQMSDEQRARIAQGLSLLKESASAYGDQVSDGDALDNARIDQDAE